MKNVSRIISSVTLCAMAALTAHPACADDAPKAPVSAASAAKAKPAAKTAKSTTAQKPIRMAAHARPVATHTISHTYSHSSGASASAIAAINSESSLTVPASFASAAACGSMIMPAVALKQVSRGFSGYHSGIDLMAPYGSPIRAAEPGRVVFAGTFFGYGNMVDLVSPNGIVTRYGHMSAFAPGLHIGTVVAMGDTIGNIGTSGQAHGPHVHFEVRIGGHAVNPAPYLGLANCPTAPSGPVIEEAQAPEISRSKMADGRPAGGFQ